MIIASNLFIYDLTAAIMRSLLKDPHDNQQAFSGVSMSYMKNTLISLAILTFTNSVIAAQNDEDTLNKSREKIVKQYIMDLQKADYKDITQLFEKDGIVISTSRGKVDAKEFFYTFLPNISSAHTELRQYFVGVTDSDRTVARFHFNFKLKDGEEGHGEYVDEFIFSKNSTKLTAVYMFENLKLTE